MTYDQVIRANKSLRELVDTMAGASGHSTDRVNQFAALLFETGQQDMRMTLLEAAWKGEDDEPKKSG